MDKKFLLIFLILIVGGTILNPMGYVLGSGACNAPDGTPGACPAGELCYCDPDPTDAEAEGKCVPAGTVVICNPIQAATFEELVENIINFIFGIALVFAPLMIIVGAFYLLTAAGDPEKIKTAKTVILYTLVGLAIVIMAKGIIVVIEEIFGI